jgi:hypothetical protein
MELSMLQEAVNDFKRKLTSLPGILKQYLRVSINLSSLHFAGVNTSSKTRFSEEMLGFINIKDLTPPPCN